MRMSKVGVFAVAILIVVAAIGFGIAQAGGNHSEQPVLSFEDQVELGRDGSSSAYTENQPVLSLEDEMQLRNPTGTGSLPEMGNTDSSIVEIGGNIHRSGIDTGDP